MLTTNPGKLVAREELQQKLWPGAGYGDQEHGLNAAVNKLRETLATPLLHQLTSRLSKAGVTASSG